MAHTKIAGASIGASVEVAYVSNVILALSKYFKTFGTAKSAINMTNRAAVKASLKTVSILLILSVDFAWCE